MAKKRIKVIAGNWKMNNTAQKAQEFIAELTAKIAPTSATVVICTPFTALERASEAIKGSSLMLGAQNISWADKGAFTGEISAEMLIEHGVKYVIIGHSERRQFFGETDASVNKRTVAALNAGLTPIVCVGESEAERLGNKTNRVLKRQVEKAFEGLSADDAARVIIAYEPIWAIGTGRTATAEDANTTIKFVRKQIRRLFGKPVGDAMIIQYGGSMNAANAAELLAQSDIDGGLIGGASLKADDFAAIVAAAGAKKAK